MNNIDRYSFILLIVLGVVIIGQWISISYVNTECMNLYDTVYFFLFGNCYHLNNIDVTRSESGNPITEVIVNY